MPQIAVGTSNISQFGYSVTFDILNRTILFNLLPFTTGPGLANTKAAFSVTDSAGVELAVIDFTNPQIPNPAASPTWLLDLSDSPYAFLFSSFSIVGSIQDQGGAVYSIPPLVKTVCMPNDFQETGAVPGMFQIITDCGTNNITVKEITVQVYNVSKPVTVTKSGTLYYPTGTIAPIVFTNTPWTNNQVWTGQYRIKNTTYATYNIGNDFYVIVGYVTDQVFDITCTNKMSNLLCCIRDTQQTAIQNCGNANGQRAKQLLEEITIPFVAGILAEMRGMDASAEYNIVKKTLSCSCGNSSIGQNESDPVNPAVNTIAISGVGGTTVAAPTITGNTKNFVIQSSAYQVTKGNPADPGFTIGLDTSVPNVVRQPITLNYLALAQQIYTATAADPATLAQFNALVQAFGLSLTGLDGSCVIDLTKVTYTAALPVTGATGVSSIFIDGNPIAAPSGLLASDTVNFAIWLNSLGLGVWTVTITSGTITVMSVDNTHLVSTITFTAPDVVLIFGRTTKTLVQILQAMISYICSLSALQIALDRTYNVCTVDYNGVPVSTSYGTGSKQSDLNQALSDATCNLASRFANLTGVTCAKMKSVFSDSPSASFNPNTDRFLSFIGGACISMTAQQAVTGILAAVNADPATKDAWCAINCSTPGTCPDVSAINMSIVSGNIGIYGVTFNGPTSASQSLRVQYRLTGTTVWTTANSNLLVFANGNVQGTSPYLITGLTPGQSYDVQIVNNCGGIGSITSITVPSSSVFNTNVLLGNQSYLVCSGSAITVYSSQILGPGAKLFYDAGLTTQVTGYLFVVRGSDGEIFNLNSSTGIVGADTASSCTTGTPGVYKLGSGIPGVCSSVNQTLYTNGAFVPGGVLYSDQALTHPVTGFTFVANLTTNHIFAINSGTGVIGADSGSLCTGTATLTMRFINASGSFLNFQGSLDRAVDGNITCSEIFADGFSDTGCTVPVSSAQKNSSMSILAGGTAMGSPPDTSPPPTGNWNIAIRSRCYNVVLNGLPVINGQVITVGSYNVTVVVSACTP